MRPEALVWGGSILQGPGTTASGNGECAQAVLDASGRACEGGCSLQGPVTPPWGSGSPAQAVVGMF